MFLFCRCWLRHLIEAKFCFMHRFHTYFPQLNVVRSFLKNVRISLRIWNHVCGFAECLFTQPAATMTDQFYDDWRLTRLWFVQWRNKRAEDTTTSPTSSLLTTIKALICSNLPCTCLINGTHGVMACSHMCVNVALRVQHMHTETLAGAALIREDFHTSQYSEG